jgi:hypothetical protein
VACSLRDILVDARPDQQHHDDRARWLTDRYFDAVLVHADPAFARLEDSFRPRRPLRTPVWHSGYVVPERAARRAVPRGEHLLVSAGGGIVGDTLFAPRWLRGELLARAAAAAHRRRPLPARAAVAGTAARRGRARRELVRHVPDMVAEMRRARASLSQCGYNTALDLVVAGVPALVVPYETAPRTSSAAAPSAGRARRDAVPAGGPLQPQPPGACHRAAARLQPRRPHWRWTAPQRSAAAAGRTTAGAPHRPGGRMRDDLSPVIAGARRCRAGRRLRARRRRRLGRRRPARAAGHDAARRRADRPGRDPAGA